MENEIYNWNPFIKGYISKEDCGKKLRYEYYEYVFEASTIDLRDRLITITLRIYLGMKHRNLVHIHLHWVFLWLNTKDISVSI